MAAVVVALIAILLAPVSPPSGSCADVFIIGARGSGQPAGFGAQAEPVVEAIEEGLRGSGLIVESAPLDYPAVSISESFGLVLLNGGYDRSVRAGAIELISELAGISRECPRSEVVLVGYSQGAQAIKSALEDLPPRHRIAAVAVGVEAGPKGAVDDVGDGTAHASLIRGACILISLRSRILVGAGALFEQRKRCQAGGVAGGRRIIKRTDAVQPSQAQINRCVDVVTEICHLRLCATHAQRKK